MGADAHILFDGIDERTAQGIAVLVEAEIDRLENALSLFHVDSELCRLNRNGHLPGPSGDLCRALTLAIEIAGLSGGLFDPTVQPLWKAHVDWFEAHPSAGLPPEDAITVARQAVDWRKIRLAPEAISLGDGQRLTLNGLGQGYVTDRVAELLVEKGLCHVLVDLGEQRAIAARRNGSPWLIARANATPLRLAHGALATSEGSGSILGANGAAHHLFDPRSGRSAAHWRTMIVHHRSAAVADALSTALYVASEDEIEAMLPRLKGTAIWAVDAEGQSRHWSSGLTDGVAS